MSLHTGLIPVLRLDCKNLCQEILAAIFRKLLPITGVGLNYWSPQPSTATLLPQRSRILISSVYPISLRYQGLFVMIRTREAEEMLAVV